MAEYIVQEQNGFAETRRRLTDDEICEQLAHRVVFSIKDKAYADGKTSITVHVQVVSAPLSDDTRREIHQVRRITVVSDEEPFVVETDANGHGTFECAFAAAGVYTFTTDGIIYSEGITIEAVER